MQVINIRKKKKIYLLKGHTLVELLIALGIFAIIGTVTLSIIFITLRSSKKSEVLVLLKQSGNATLSQVVKNIRYAKSLDSPSSCITPVTTSSIAVTSYLDNAQTTYSCVGGPSSTIASNGAVLTDIDTTTVSNCSFTCSQPTLNDSPTINFNFTLNTKNSNGLIESSGSIPFQSSVTLRNIN